LIIRHVEVRGDVPSNLSEFLSFLDDCMEE